MASGVTGSVSVALHPLVILNISDHWIRIRSQEGRPMQGVYDNTEPGNVPFVLCFAKFFCSLCFSSTTVIGALIGKQEGRNIEVMNSFELLSHTTDDRVHIDKEYYYTKEEQCKWCLCVKYYICLCLYFVYLCTLKSQER